MVYYKCIFYYINYIKRNCNAKKCFIKRYVPIHKIIIFDMCVCESRDCDGNVDIHLRILKI